MPCAEADTVKRIKLPNGLVIVTKPGTANAIVSVVVHSRMGSMYETDEQAGLATLMQDTILKGTTTRSADDIALELERMGTRLGTGADREYGSVALQSTAGSLFSSLDIMYDILLNATFPDDAVTLQKQLQAQSIMLRNDQPLYRAVDLMVEAHYGTHPFHKPRLGYPETLPSLSRDDLLTCYRATYVPNNMVVTVVGNFDREALIDHISAGLGELPSGELPVPVTGERPEIEEPVEQIEQRDTAASWFALGWPSASLTDSDYYAMEVLDSITGGSMNSRLFVAIREQRGLAYQVSSFVNARLDSGIYAAYVGTKPESYDEARRVLVEEVQRMSTEEATSEEIENAQSFLKGMHIMGSESNAGQASQYGLYEVLGLGYEEVDRYPDGITGVTAKDIITAGQRYLTGPYALGGVLASE
jgi:zinc protease